MTPKVFLSLSFVDRNYVSAVHSRLPAGLAYFYEASFENGENLIEAMEKSVAETAVFVLFASKQAAKSPWVGFEIDQARLQKIQRSNYRILVFPVDREFNYRDLPDWLRAYWVPKAGLLPSDVSRYITALLLEPNVGLSAGSVKVIGRGKTLDQLGQITADHIARKKRSPNIYFLSGFRGIGRRTFAAYYMRAALGAEANLPYGPVLSLPSQADIADLFSELRTEISPAISTELMSAEYAAFSNLEFDKQILEIGRLLSHFSDLGQSVTIASSAGFFEDAGAPKSWVEPLLRGIPSKSTIFIVSNRQLPPPFVEKLDNLVQMRVEELHETDIRALMVFTANRYGMTEFEPPSKLIKAIGGHADVANAAVRLAAVKGIHILERDPAQLYNIQNTIIGESIAEDALTAVQKATLGLLSWVPRLNSSLLEITLLNCSFEKIEILNGLEDLIMGCLVTITGSEYAISPAIRMMFRRFHVTSSELLLHLSNVLNAEWKNAQLRGEFRADLFETFVFMHSLEGKYLPAELVRLVTPGMLDDVIRQMYARGKEEADVEALTRVIKWGQIAHEMKMSDATRESILSSVVRAEIRLGDFQGATKTIDAMSQRKYRSVPFLRGHLFRRMGKYSEAIDILVAAVEASKFNRSAVHELALAYKKSGRANDLRKLLDKHSELIADSAMFADFQIGVHLARGDFTSAEVSIERLKLMPDDDGRSDIRATQLLIRKGQNDLAKEVLTGLLKSSSGDKLRLRSIRAIAAARGGDFDLARQDIAHIGNFPSWKGIASRLEAGLLIEQKRPIEAKKLLQSVGLLGSEDWLLFARALRAESELPETSLTDSLALKERAIQIQNEHNFALEYDFEE